MVVMSGKEVLENKLMILRKEVVGVEKNLNYDVTGAGGICDSFANLICERVFNEAYQQIQADSVNGSRVQKKEDGKCEVLHGEGVGCDSPFEEGEKLELVLGNLDEMSTKGRHVGYHEYAGTVCEKIFNDVYDQLKSNSLQK